MRLRTADAADGRFLTEVLAWAADWKLDQPRSAAQVMADPALRRYLTGWPRVGDLGLIAEEDGMPVGGVWWRLMSADEPGYGFVDEHIPEITVGVHPDHRGRGIGTELLRGLLDQGRRQHLPALSLSVEDDNPARRLYERLGFRAQHHVGGASTMRREIRAWAQ